MQWSDDFVIDSPRTLVRLVIPFLTVAAVLAAMVTAVLAALPAGAGA